MLLTALGFLVVLAGIVPGLRNLWFGIHGALIILTVFVWTGQQDTPPGMMTPESVKVIFIIHLLVIQISTILAYGWDKFMAQRGGWRISEKTLHAFAFIGGTPGALIGSKFFRHKTIKGAFRKMFWAVVILQIMVLIIGCVVITSMGAR